MQDSINKSINCLEKLCKNLNNFDEIHLKKVDEMVNEYLLQREKKLKGNKKGNINQQMSKIDERTQNIVKDLQQAVSVFEQQKLQMKIINNGCLQWIKNGKYSSSQIITLCKDLIIDISKYKNIEQYTRRMQKQVCHDDLQKNLLQNYYDQMNKELTENLPEYSNQSHSYEKLWESYRSL